MKVSPQGLSLIKQFEGCRLVAYQDAVGVWTIGYGHTAMAGPPNPKRGMHITLERAELLLIADLHQYEKAVTDRIVVELKQYQFDALASFCFNVGIRNFRHSTLATLCNQSKFDDAAKQFVRWCRAGGKVLPGLVSRRKAEAKLFVGKPAE